MTPSELRLLPYSTILDSRALLCVELAFATAERDEEGIVRLTRQLHQADNSTIRAAYETVLQTHLFAGFPKTIFALSLMHKGGLTPPNGIDHGLSGHEVSQAGQALCERIYAQSYRPLREKMASLHPDFDRWMVNTGYGRVLSRPGLSARERELAVLPVLAAQSAWPQLQSHVAGARRCEALVEEIWASLAVWAQRTDELQIASGTKHAVKALQRLEQL